jgi:hypothetical protein
MTRIVASWTYLNLTQLYRNEAAFDDGPEVEVIRNIRERCRLNLLEERFGYFDGSLKIVLDNREQA